ncbi:YhgE/Pip domain-containing protein [Paenibacillus massiliensis]|uniref:YhgE/Pip domain-containing protein n=1 Tax=Paenibacillus massiliensis TaxID=225917 RepID=UPI000427E245|nr:YhgE/Pip domain-containing protein [Paenibacillus massiliensis]
MRNIWQIYIQDWRNVGKVSTGILLVIAIALLPSVYAWINLKAMWDPYANTSGIKVAVTSQDQGAEVNGKHINVGEEVISNLHKNQKLGWTFVDAEEARRGVETGEYYASLLIPEDFSTQISSVLTENPQKPEIDYAVNEKVNAIAPKITSSGATALTAQISQNFIETASRAVLTKLKEAGIQLEEELPTIRNIENRVLELNDRLVDVESLGQQALELEQKLPEIKQQGEKILALRDRIPEINKAGDVILKVEGNLDKLDEVGQIILDVQKRLPGIQKAGDRIVELDSNFGKVEDALDTAIEDTALALEVIDAAQQALPQLQQIAETGGDFAGGIQQFLKSNEAAFDAVGDVTKQNLVLVQQIADETTQIIGLVRDADLDPQLAAERLNRMEGRLNTAAAIVGRLSGMLGTINSYLPSAPLDGVISRIDTVRGRLTELSSTLGRIEQAIRQGQEPASKLLDQADQLSRSISGAVGDILSRYDSDVVPAIRQALQQLQTIAGNSANVLQSALEQLPKLDKLLSDAKEAALFGQQELNQLKGDLPQIRSKLHEAASTIQTRMGDFTTAVNEAADFVNQDLPGVKEKIHRAADFVRNDLPRVESEFVKMADLIEERFPEIERAVHQVAAFVRDDLPAAENAIRKAADTILSLRKGNEIGKVIELLKGDVQKESDFLGNPVELKEERLYPIPNYGSAMSPFYTTLSIWVGAMLLVSMFRVDVEDPERRYKSYQVYFGRYMTFATIGIFQAISVTLGDLFLLGTYVSHPVLFVLSSMLISLVFTAITYTLVSVFGNIGKGLAVILLVLQFSSSGGTFPVSTSSAFFQALNPVVPFTYAVSLLRETVGGILPETVLRDVVMLLIFIGICFVVALLLKKPLSRITERMAERARETKLIP